MKKTHHTQRKREHQKGLVIVKIRVYSASKSKLKVNIKSNRKKMLYMSRNTTNQTIEVYLHVESSLNFGKGNIKIVESNICKMEQFNPLKNHAESQQQKHLSDYLEKKKFITASIFTSHYLSLSICFYLLQNTTSCSTKKLQNALYVKYNI